MNSSLKAAALAISIAASFNQSAQAQTGNDTSPTEDTFLDAVEGYLETKVRQGLTEKALQETVNEAIGEMAKKVPGLIAKRSYLAVLLEGLNLSVTIAPVGIGSDSLPDALDQGCTATEEQLYSFFATRVGIAAANNLVVATANAPTTQIVSRSPFAYRIQDQELCNQLSAHSN